MTQRTNSASYNELLKAVYEKSKRSAQPLDEKKLDAILALSSPIKEQAFVEYVMNLRISSKRHSLAA